MTKQTILTQHQQTLLNSFAHNLHHTVSYLKKTADQKLGKHFLKQQSWSLILGPEQSGKSQLVNHSGINFSHAPAVTDQYNNFHVSNNAVFIDTPGSLINDPAQHALWPSLIKKLQKCRGKRAIDNVIVVFNIANLLQQHSLRHHPIIDALTNTLAVINQQLRHPIPVFIVLTHSDQIAGFNQFVSFSPRQQREQALGITLEPQQQALLTHYDSEFIAFLNRLHQHGLQLLPRTNSPEKRRLIKEFPLQLESLQLVIKQLLESLFKVPGKSKLLPRGIYLVSNCQQGQIVNRIDKTFASRYQTSAPEPEVQVAQGKCYFTKQLLESIIPNDRYTVANAVSDVAKRTWRHRFAYAAIAIITVGSTAWMTVQFNHTRTAIEHAETALHIYQTAEQQPSVRQNILALLKNLKPLTVAQQQINSIHTSRLNDWLFPNARKLQHAINNSLTHNVRQIIIPYLKQQLEQSLADKTVTDPNIVFSNLKAYLMLGEPTHLDSSYLAHWLVSDLQKQQQWSVEEINLLTAYLRQSLTTTTPLATLNTQLIHQARQTLQQLPQSYLAYLFLKHQSQQHYHAAPISSDVFNYPRNYQAIPFLYTRNGFSEIYQKQIAHIAQKIISGDWILGNKPETSPEPQQIAHLAHEIQTLYTADYVNWWHLFLYNIQPAVFTNLQHAQSTYVLLSQVDSPMIQLIHLVQNNTHVISGDSQFAKVFNQNIAKQFSQFNALNADDIKALQPLFIDLANFYAQFNDAPDPDVLAFNVTKQEFLQPSSQFVIERLFTAAQHAPAPIQSWLHHLAMNSWYLLIANTGHHINHRWQTLYDHYQQTIAQRFPIDASAQETISLSDFSRFFGPQGELQQFVQHYLQPFIDTSSNQWQVKHHQALQLTVAPTTLDNLLRARLVQHMFFPTGTQQLQVNFSLQALAFEPIVKTLSLAIGNTKFTDSQTHNAIHLLQWPSDQSNHITLTLQDIDGKQLQTEKHGDWALWQLLQQTNLTRLNDTEHFSLIFALAGSAVKYQLTADNAINPFIPGILTQFKLPEKIV